LGTNTKSMNTNPRTCNFYQTTKIDAYEEKYFQSIQSSVNTGFRFIQHLTVVENSLICKFSRIYFIEFESKKKSTEITLLARTLAISFNIYSMFHFLLHNYTADLSNVLKLSRIFATQ
jgi:hypothetical protein